LSGLPGPAVAAFRANVSAKAAAPVPAVAGFQALGTQTAPLASPVGFAPVLRESGLFDLTPAAFHGEPASRLGPAAFQDSAARVIAIPHATPAAAPFQRATRGGAATPGVSRVSAAAVQRAAPRATGANGETLIQSTRRAAKKRGLYSLEANGRLFDGGARAAGGAHPVAASARRLRANGLLRGAPAAPNAAAPRASLPAPGRVSAGRLFLSSFSPKTFRSVIAGMKTLFAKRRSTLRERRNEESSVVQINEWSDYLDLALKAVALLTFAKPFLAWEMILTAVVLKGDWDLKRYANADSARARRAMRNMFLALAGLMTLSLGAGFMIPGVGSWAGVLLPAGVGLAAISISAALEVGVSLFDWLAARWVGDRTLADEAMGKFVDGSSTAAAAVVVALATLASVHAWWLEAIPVIVLIAVSIANAIKLGRPARTGLKRRETRG
jgi:hypothetical protein